MRKREGAHDTSNRELIKMYFVELLQLNNQRTRDPFTTYNSHICHNLLARVFLPYDERINQHEQRKILLHKAWWRSKTLCH